MTKGALLFYFMLSIILGIALILGPGKPKIKDIEEINQTPEDFLERTKNPNIKIVPPEKNKSYKFVIFSEEFDVKKYREKFGDEDLIIVYSDYSGFDGKGKGIMIFSDRLPDPEFFKK